MGTESLENISVMFLLPFTLRTAIPVLLMISLLLPDQRIT